MFYNSLAIACILSMICIASCNSRSSDDAQKSDGSPTAGELEPPPDQLDSSLLSSEEDPDKRAWHKLNNVWGKRADWNKLNGMWGKRSDWNKLNGMWGKRADWNKLNNMWGKRETSEIPPYWGKRGWNNLSNVWGKRTSGRDDGSKRTTQWNNLKSVWGKRDSEWDVPAMWDSIPAEESFPEIYIPEQM